jgi:hypothetical protein
LADRPRTLFVRGLGVLIAVFRGRLLIVLLAVLMVVLMFVLRVVGIAVCVWTPTQRRRASHGHVPKRSRLSCRPFLLTRLRGVNKDLVQRMITVTN